MASTFLLDSLLHGQLFDSLWTDFLIALVFFTALSFAVLGRRLGQHRPAVAVSAALGLALAIGLVSWEWHEGWSIRNLGPLAIGLALLVLGSVIFQALRQVGGSAAGAALAFGAALLIGWALGLDYPIAAELVQGLILLAILGGVVAFFLHRGGPLFEGSALPPGLAWRRPRVRGEPSVGARHDLSDLEQDFHVAEGLGRDFDEARRTAQFVERRPELARELKEQLRRMLPKEGWLTGRMAKLRERAHHTRKGQLAQLREAEHIAKKLPAAARRQLAEELRRRYESLHIAVRIERLDRSVAEAEKRIKELNELAIQLLERKDYRRVPQILDAAARLQSHVATLMTLIGQAEQRLILLVEELAKDQGGKQA